jgi:hypothetical protein
LMLSESDILNVLRSQPGVRGSEIASRLKAEKPEVNSILWKIRDLQEEMEHQIHRLKMQAEEDAIAIQQQIDSDRRLAPLGAGEVQESVKFSSREKLALCKVVEGAVKLSPGRGQRVAPLEVVGEFRIEQD